MPKLVGTAGLAKINRRSRAAHLNRWLTLADFRHIDPSGVHVVESHFVHGDLECIRCEILVKMIGTNDPARMVVDMTFEDFNGLMTFEEYSKAHPEVMNEP